MPTFKDDSSYHGVNAIAERNGLIWDGRYGSPYDIAQMIPLELRDTEELENYQQLFDHTQRFKVKGRGQRQIVMAISSPYLKDDETLRADVAAFCDRFGLDARVGDEEYRIYSNTSTLPIVFWRPDLHRPV